MCRGLGYVVAILCFGGTLVCAAVQQPALSDLSSKPVPPAQAIRTARTLMQSNRFAEAENTLRAYLLDHDRSGEAHELLGYALLRQNKPKDSLSEYTRAAALETPSANMLVHVGQAYALLGDDADADKWTSLAVQKDSSDADAWYGLGRIRYGEQKFADALSCFHRVLALVPKSVKAENNLGLAYEALNRPDEAAAAYRQAIAWQQGVPPVERSEQPLLNLGTMLMHDGHLAEAEPMLREAVSIRPSDASAHEELGQLATQQGHFEEAQREFARACELDPGKSSLHFLLGQSLKHLGRQQEAAAEFAVAARLANEHVTPESR